MLKKNLTEIFFNFHIPIARYLHRLRCRKPKLRLIAVAKNEARYLPEWLLHHLFFGVDDIEVYYNQCSDNTQDLSKVFSKLFPIKFINADSSFQENCTSPQIKVYREALNKAYKDRCSHVLFLDVDEFLFPKDMKLSIKSLVCDKNDLDVICVNWLNKLNDKDLFGRAFEKQMSVEVSPTIKSIVKSFLGPVPMNPHTVISSQLKYGTSGSIAYCSERLDLSKVKNVDELYEESKLFILHRQYRSEKEYIAMLGRGRPIGASRKTSLFKNNRRGYNVHENQTDIFFSDDSFEIYNDYLEKFLSLTDVVSSNHAAEKSVLTRYEEVVELIANAPETEKPVLEKLLKNITLTDVKRAHRSMYSNQYQQE